MPKTSRMGSGSPISAPSPRIDWDLEFEIPVDSGARVANLRLRPYLHGRWHPLWMHATSVVGRRESITRMRERRGDGNYIEGHHPSIGSSMICEAAILIKGVLSTTTLHSIGVTGDLLIVGNSNGIG
ncbi:hypothetical protein CRG98_033866 [Punica granatum]|uniref:Uncharacterized protein n=1 Tax=Punica granatum TaxID=22663 RepID=A0A2I0IPT4_PUNGR|nr:hypothetical protein CRG98_033866 [Punica granatum]